MQLIEVVKCRSIILMRIGISDNKQQKEMVHDDFAACFLISGLEFEDKVRKARLFLFCDNTDKKSFSCGQQ